MTHNPKRSLDELARQLKMPPIGLSEEQLNNLVKAGAKMRLVLDFIEHLNKHGMHIAINVGTDDIPLTDKEIHDLLLDYFEISKEDAEKAANYIVNTTNMLSGKGE